MVKVKVDSSGYGGRKLLKRMQVYTSDRQNRVISLKVTGQVEKIVNIVPQVVRLTGPFNETIRSRVKINPAEKYPFSITGTEIKRGQDILADLQKISEKDNTWELVVENRKSTIGRYFDVITLITDSKLKPRIKIRVFGNIVDRGKEAIRQTP
ncbi:MAG TPA: hypothetical protein VJ936_05305 [Desulfobacteraceae bacterium]|nr:hypothetical protein [Desulfobacteraceae bacterium]